VRPRSSASCTNSPPVCGTPRSAGLIGYLGFLAAISLGTALGKEYRRPSLGHWVALIRQALRTPEVGWPLAAFRALIPQADEFLGLLDQVVNLRNRVAHGPALEEGAVLHDWVQRMSVCIRGLYKSLLCQAQFALVAVEDLDYQEEGQFVLKVRGLEGTGGASQSVQVKRPKPCTKGRVYLATSDFATMVSLFPWIVLAKCPLCFQQELFFYTSADDKQLHYVTPDRGHGWSCPTPREFDQLISGYLLGI
jgi:hypothetical protein